MARPVVVCMDCGARAPHYAKSRCARCYARSRIRLIDCSDCGQRRKEHRGGRCARCYRLAKTTEAVCGECGELRRCWAGVCQRCKTRRRATGGSCSSCGRTVSRLWAGGRCAFCAHANWSVGSCTHCYAWALSITGQPPCCRACRDFARRNQTGECRSCRRLLPVSRHRRCRLCTAARRWAELTEEIDLGTEPAQASGGVQLFLGDLELGRGPGARSSRPSSPTAAETAETVSMVEDSHRQLELFRMRPDPPHADPAAAAWARTPTGRDRLAELAAFAAARGWPTPTRQQVAHAVALVAVAEDPARCLSPKMATELRQRRLPIGRLREFLTSQRIQDRDVETTPTLPTLPTDLPTTITKELTVWVEVLAGQRGRAQPHAGSTIAAYQRIVGPIVRDWAQDYASLREVTRDDIAAQVDPLTGSTRTSTAVALRSLFAALKSQRMVFTDPARRVRPGRFPRRPVLGLDDATRAALLAGATRTDHRLLLLLAGVHALSRADIAALRLDDVDLGARRLRVHNRWVSLDEPTYHQLRAWTEQRRARWPASANPHLFITGKSACNLAAVSTGYFRNLPIPLTRLRADRLLAAAADSNADPLMLVRLFGVSDDTAVRYCTELDPPQPPDPST